MIHLPILLLVLAGAKADATRVAIPGQPVQVSIAIPGFVADAQAYDPERVLVSGQTKSGCIVSILYQENFPYVSSKDAAGRLALGRSRGQTFAVGEVSCCESRTEVRDTIVETTFQAWPATPEYLFDIHVSFVQSREEVGQEATFTRNTFIDLVKSFRLEGVPDVNRFAFPPEVYTFRNEAAKAETDSFSWLSKQCAVRPGDWVPQLYLGMLADANDRHSFVIQGYTRAVDLLGDVKDRTAKQTRTLMFALERAALAHVDEEKFEKAIPFWERAVRTAKPGDPPEIQRFREEALFHLACCYAMNSQRENALTTLKLAIEVRPDFKERAIASNLFASLRALDAFRQLVGGAH
ncbi:MAG: tetratricopeptide repeat protein [Planctomycetota bacterium]